MPQALPQQEPPQQEPPQQEPPQALPRRVVQTVLALLYETLLQLPLSVRVCRLHMPRLGQYFSKK
jgi:hypothetical protein